MGKASWAQYVLRRPILPPGWTWEENKYSTAWGPHGSMCSYLWGELQTHGQVPTEVQEACRVAWEGHQ